MRPVTREEKRIEEAREEVYRAERALEVAKARLQLVKAEAALKMAGDNDED